MVANVFVRLKPGILDPQGNAIHQALESLGFAGVNNVRTGKWIVLELSYASRERAKREVEKMCRKLLANPVVETYRIELTKT